MQIFRPFESHTKSAMYLDDKRLNKQVLECFQIINMCFRGVGLLNDGRPISSWSRHPVVRYIYNDGNPYCPDLWVYMDACDREWIRRGRVRNPEFRAKILNQLDIINDNWELFNWSPMPNIMRFGDKEVIGKDAAKYHRALLRAKWMYDTLPNKCSIKLS